MPLFTEHVTARVRNLLRSPRDPWFHLVLQLKSLLWDGELLQPGNGSKWFDPKTSSTRGVPGPQSMANTYHTQKNESEP